jgi:hypothetical protein
MTSTEFFVETMESWGKHGEPKAILVIFTDEAGDITVTGNNCSYSHGMGLAMYALEHLRRKIFEQPPNSPDTDQ